MATKEPKEKKKSAGAPPGAKQPKGEGKKKKGGEQKAARVPHAGAGKPVPAPRLKEFYQTTVRRKAKKSIANFGLREGQEIGASVTLRGARMWEFFDRFVTVALPRVRDFRGVGTK